MEVEHAHWRDCEELIRKEKLIPDDHNDIRIPFPDLVHHALVFRLSADDGNALLLSDDIDGFA